jgi:hypothetical protein
MRHFTKLMIERQAERIIAITAQIKALEAERRKLPPRYWHRKRSIADDIKERKSWIRHLNNIRDRHI